MQAQHLRHQYLETLGISSWLPRGELPGAAKSEPWVAGFVYSEDVLSDISAQTSVDALTDTKKTAEVTPSSEVQSANLNSNKASNNSAAQIKSLSASLHSSSDAISQQAAHMAHEVVTHLPAAADNLADSQPVSSSVNEQPADFSKSEQNFQARAVPDSLETKVVSEMPVHAPLSVSTSKANSSTKPAPVMRLMFWQFPDVLVIDSLPTHTRGTLTSIKYEQLLSNMINAMQFDSKRLDADSQPYVLNWPTLAGLSIDQGWDQAVSAVQHKLAKLLQNYSPKIVLMLGEPAAQMVMNLEDDFDAMRGIVFSVRSDIKSITTNSLTEMLNIPGCKREVWQDLQKVLQP